MINAKRSHYGTLWPNDPRRRFTVVQWLMRHMAGRVGVHRGALLYSQKNMPDMVYPAERYDKKPGALLGWPKSGWANRNISRAISDPSPISVSGRIAPPSNASAQPR